MLVYRDIVSNDELPTIKRFTNNVGSPQKNADYPIDCTHSAQMKIKETLISIEHDAFSIVHLEKIHDVRRKI